MLNLPINKDFEDQDHLEDGIDDFTPTPKDKPYNDDDYDN